MKIMLCGKGGCGKSTISTLLANEYIKTGKKVLVLDTDESNYGLHRQLGLPLPKDFTLYFGSKRGIFHAIDQGEKGANPFGNKWSLASIPEEYLSVNGDLRLMAIGKIHEAGEGCACPMGTLARCFIENLELQEDEIVIVDAEAGVEHFGRGVDATVDTILMIADPSYESLQLSKKIGAMGKAIGKPVYYVINKVTANEESVMRSAIADPDAVIAAVPQNTEVLTKGLMGQPLDTCVPEAAKIIAFLEKLK